MLALAKCVSKCVKIADTNEVVIGMLECFFFLYRYKVLSQNRHESEHWFYFFECKDKINMEKHTKLISFELIDFINFHDIRSPD